MANILLLSPHATSGIAASRGTGGPNLGTPDPKEVWVDSAVGTNGYIYVDLGTVRPVDTLFLGAIYNAAADAECSVTYGVEGYWEQNLFAGALRAPDAAGQFAAVSHFFWHGAPINARCIAIGVRQPTALLPLAVGRVMVGQAFKPAFNKEWGSGRRVIDTGTSTALPSGGFANVKGVRKGAYSWTQGDLTDAEVDTLYALQLAHGETEPLLVVEDPEATAGLRFRIHYGLFRSLKAFERRNPIQTRWELTIEEWV